MLSRRPYCDPENGERAGNESRVHQYEESIEVSCANFRARSLRLSASMRSRAPESRQFPLMPRDQRDVKAPRVYRVARDKFITGTRACARSPHVLPSARREYRRVIEKKSRTACDSCETLANVITACPGNARPEYIMQCPQFAPDRRDDRSLQDRQLRSSFRANAPLNAD